MWEFDLIWELGNLAGDLDATDSRSCARCRKEWADHLACGKKRGQRRRRADWAAVRRFVRVRADAQTQWPDWPERETIYG
jgi:hypothetical protein